MIFLIYTIPKPIFLLKIALEPDFATFCGVSPKIPDTSAESFVGSNNWEAESSLY